MDFVINDNEERYYIQVAYSLSEQNKINQELKPLKHIKDNFKKVVITFDDIKPYTTDDGIRVVNIYDFLLTDSIKKYRNLTDKFAKIQEKLDKITANLKDKDDGVKVI